MNVQATIVGGEMDEQFSNETAFQAAGADAVRKAMRDNIVLLEPVMRVEVTVPEEFLGPVTADLNARRGEIQKLPLARQRAACWRRWSRPRRCSTTPTRCAA